MNEPKWKKNPGYCPDEIIGNDVEVFIVDWESYSKRSRKPEYLDWKIDGIPHILKYRDWTAWAQENKRVWNGEGLPSVGERAKSPRGLCIILGLDAPRGKVAVQCYNSGLLDILQLSVIKPLLCDEG